MRIERVFLAVFATCIALAASGRAAPADWQPAPMRSTATTLERVLARNANATGVARSGFAERREQYLYRNGTHELTVDVAVKGEDYRSSIRLGGGIYTAGRLRGTPWRANANGIAHATLSDLQGDALDRLPRSLFPFAPGDCTLLGETTRGAPAWVVLDRPAHDKPHWFFVDEASGLIVREVTREGRRAIDTTFEDFEAIDGTRRPRRWHVADGDRGNDLDVRVQTITEEPVDAGSVAPPAHRRAFAPLGPAAGAVALPVHFDGPTIVVDVELDGRRRAFILDTGTPGIVVDRDLAARLGEAPLLEHASVAKMIVGGVGLTDVSVLAIPLRLGRIEPIDGILGYDFFVGNVVHVDYPHRRVEIFTHAAGDVAFEDPRMVVLPADVTEGVPLVRAGFGAAIGDRFALDTGSPQLHVFDPFVQRYRREIATHWPPAVFSGGRAVIQADYLEGSVEVAAHRVASFALGPVRFTDATVGVEQPKQAADAIAIPLDGIVGTDELSRLDLWFDYDDDRIGIERPRAKSGNYEGTE
ncbi:MAG TPA: retropepsin-like aspartic protease [Candidatus Acidoferrum sp.]|nr:retropepsin-like aspartic protease [Candidatus Acidoferrum sp.]